MAGGDVSLYCREEAATTDAMAPHCRSGEQKMSRSISAESHGCPQQGVFVIQSSDAVYARPLMPKIEQNPTTGLWHQVAELQECLRLAHAEHAQQDAKALAILEVKDEVIAQLETDLECRESELQKSEAAEAHVQDHLERTVVAQLRGEVAVAEANLRKAQAAEHYASEASKCFEEEFTKEMQRWQEGLQRELAASERNAASLASDLQMESRVAAQAQRKATNVERRFAAEAARSRAVWSAEIDVLEQEESAVKSRLDSLGLEMEAAHAEAVRHELAEQSRPSIGELEQLQEELQRTEKRLHEAQQAELSQAEEKVQPRELLEALSHEVAEVRRVAQEARCGEQAAERYASLQSRRAQLAVEKAQCKILAAEDAAAQVSMKARCEILLAEATAAATDLETPPKQKARCTADAAVGSVPHEASVSTQTLHLKFANAAVEADLPSQRTPRTPIRRFPAPCAPRPHHQLVTQSLASSVSLHTDTDIRELRSELNQLREELAKAADAVKLAESWKISYEDMARQVGSLSKCLESEAARRTSEFVASMRHEVFLETGVTNQRNIERDGRWRIVHEAMSDHRQELRLLRKELQDHVAVQRHGSNASALEVDRSKLGDGDGGPDASSSVAPSLTVALLAATTQLAHACRGLTQDRLVVEQQTRRSGTRELGVSVSAEDLQQAQDGVAVAASRVEEASDSSSSRILAEAFSAEALAARANQELQECCQELAHVTISEHEAHSLAAAALASAEQFQQELDDARAEASRERARATRVVASEGAAYRAHSSEVRELQEAERRVQGKVEVAEAKVVWVEVANEEEKESLRTEQRSSLAEIRRESAAELQTSLREREQLQAKLHDCQMEKAAVEGEAQDLSMLLASARDEFEVWQCETNANEELARQEEHRLEQELASAHAREAILLQQLDRLREALSADKALQTSKYSSHKAGNHSLASLKEEDSSDSSPPVVAAVASTASDGEVDKSQKLWTSIGGDSSDRSTAEASSKDALPDRRSQNSSELKRLQRLHAQEKEHRERLRARADAAEAEAMDLREKLRDLESQSKLLREEADRRRSMITTLQQRVRGSDSARKAEKDAEDAKHVLTSVRRELTRRDSALSDMRQELSEARHRRLEMQSKEEATEGRLEAEMAKVKAARAESQRKDQALRNARAQADALQLRLRSEERECEAKDAQIKRLKATAGLGAKPKQSLALRNRDAADDSSRASARTPAAREGPAEHQLDAAESPFVAVRSSSSSSSLAPKVEAARPPPLPESEPCQGSRRNPVSQLPPKDSARVAVRETAALWSSASLSGQSLPSSIDAATLAESIHILNLSGDDLSDFLADGTG
mmetsp:Transcript_10400/g.23522  ORF Transcript_10400/g.23522 Transcript_10400/m.23522 type:complete len:1340 (+) Transcript_10400:92-4111(+)